MKEILNRLSGREKIVIGIGALALILLMILQLFYLPARDRIRGLDKAFATQAEQLTRMGQMQQQVRKLSGRADAMSSGLHSRQKGFALFSFLEDQAKKSQLKDRITYMKPFSQDAPDGTYSISRVKLKLEKVFLTDLVEFLSRVETSPNDVQILSLSLSKSGRKGELLDAVIETRALFPKEAG